MKKIIFLIIIVFAILGEISRIYFKNAIAISLLDIASFFSLIYIIIFYFKNKRDSSFKNLKYFILFILICFISLVFNFKNFTFNQIIISALYLFRFISYSSIYFLVTILYKKNKSFVENVLLIWGFIFIFLGFLQYFLYPNLRNLYYLGWDDHLYRLFSTFLDPNFAGLFIASFLFFLLSRFYNLHILFKSKYTFFSNAKLYLIFVLSFIALLLTYSRGALVGFFGSFIIFILISKNKIYKYLLALFIILFIIFAIFFTHAKSEGVNLFRTYSIGQRLISLDHGLIIFSKSPILGVGFNTYRYEQEKLKFVLPKTNLNHSAAGTDNSFLFILATTGIIGFFAYLFLIFKILEVKANKNFKLYNLNIKDKLILFSILTIFISSLFINAIFYPPIMVWLWSMFAVIGCNLHE